MSSRAKQKLEAALQKTNQLPDDWFGTIQASIEDLPSIQAKTQKVRKNIFIDKGTADRIEDICKKHNVSFTDVANDILAKFVQGKKP
jgi:hypothetical protein